ncbi:unnamed protein product, partial [Ilex paraguariensis]
IVNVRNKVQKKFKTRGYTIKVKALTKIFSFLNHFQDAKDEALDLHLDELQHQSLKASILDKELVHQMVSLLWEIEVVAAMERTHSSDTQ